MPRARSLAVIPVLAVTLALTAAPLAQNQSGPSPATAAAGARRSRAR